MGKMEKDIQKISKCFSNFVNVVGKRLGVSFNIAPDGTVQTVELPNGINLESRQTVMDAHMKRFHAEKLEPKPKKEKVQWWHECSVCEQPIYDGQKAVVVSYRHLIACKPDTPSRMTATETVMAEDRFLAKARERMEKIRNDAIDNLTAEHILTSEQMREAFKPGKPEPECKQCICAHEMNMGRVPRDFNCPKHRDKAREDFKEYTQWVDSKKQPDPAPPLNVRVAKALPLPECTDCGSVMMLKQFREFKSVVDPNPKTRSRLNWRYECGMCHNWQRINSYDSDLTLAIGALEEYCRKHNTEYLFAMCNDGSGKIYIGRWMIRGEKPIIEDGCHGVEKGINDSFSTAICLAIVKHSEGA